MKPEELTPEQMVRVMALGTIVMGLFFGAMIAWILFIVRQQRGKRFSLAKAPLATYGAIDVVVGIAFLIFVVFGIQLVWLTIHGPTPQATSQAVEASSDANAPAPASDDATSSVETAAQTTTTETNQAESTATNTETNPAEKLPAWGKLTQEKLLFSGVVSTMQLAAVVFLLLFVRTRTNCGSNEIGWTPQRFTKDILVGGLVLLMTLPVLLVTSGVINKISGVEYTHPLIDAMNEFPWMIGILAWQAVIVAPISEEFFFRSVLIGWFESIHFGRSFPSFWNGWTSPLRAQNNQKMSEISEAKGVRPLFESNASANPYRFDSSAASTARGANAASSETPDSTLGISDNYNPPWWPVILSGTLFGLAHFSYGVSWIPLILFGIVLGRVYQYRQSLITCIAIHMFFNGINLLNLWLAMGLPKP